MYEKIRPFLFKLDPEMAHEMAHAGLQIAQKIPYITSFLSSFYSFPSTRLNQKLLGLDFINPVGLAAGFDKNASVVDAMSALGFGFLELGSVTNKPCIGNDRPRLFRLENDEALINRMGLNNTGPYRFLDNLLNSKSQIPKLVSISKTNDSTLNGEQAINDILECYKTVGSLSEIVVFNLSCPNTKDGKTFEDAETLTSLLDAIIDVRKSEDFKHPFLVKFSSDVNLENLKNFLDISLDRGVSGFVLCNTSNSREGLRESKESIDSIGRGGLSGKPLYEKSLERISLAYRHTGGKVPIIGVGGVDSSQRALNLIKAGASFVEIYTALVYKGPAIIKEILEGIEKELVKHGMLSISELVGKDNK